MSSSFFIARRICRESDGGKQVSRPAAPTAMAGITIGLAMVIIAVAAVIGFESEVRNKVTGLGSHVQITSLGVVGPYGAHSIVVGGSMMTALADHPEISHIQYFSTKLGMIKTENAFQRMVLKGVGPEFNPHLIKEYLVEGEMLAFSDSVSSNQVPISKTSAIKMKLKLGDEIHTYYIQGDIRARRLTITGIYQTDLSEYDNLFLLTDLNLVNQLNGWQPEQVADVELQVKDYDRLGDVTYEIATSTDNQMDKPGGIYYVRSIEQLNPQIFAQPNLLDLNVRAVLFLVMGVAGFTMISGLLIIIVERTNMAGILKALRANNSAIRRTFPWLATFLIGRGMSRGNAIGSAFCIFQSQFGLFKPDPKIHYVGTVPVSFDVLLFVLINLGTLFASVLMLIGSSFLIIKINPTNSMRYE